MYARIAVKMNDIAFEDRLVSIGKGLHIGSRPDSDFVVPHFDLRVVSHRDRMVVPGHAVLGPGQTWLIGIENLSVEITYQRPAESFHFEPPIKSIGLMCATALMVVFTTFWETATDFVHQEPEVAIAATALSAQLGVSYWTGAVVNQHVPLQDMSVPQDYPVVIFSEGLDDVAGH
jgi:hypothetical protein